MSEDEKTAEEDVARRVHPDEGDYQYVGDDSKAEFKTDSADESGNDGWQKG